MQAESLALNGLEAVSVCRPGKWGNHFVVKRRRITGLWYVWNTRNNFDSHLFPNRYSALTEACLQFRWHFDCEDIDAYLAPLRGKNLACFCPLDQPCHADVLLKLANRK